MKGHDHRPAANPTTKPPGPRVALVTNVLAHYRVPCFEHLAAALPGRVTFFLLAEEMAHRHYVLTDRPTELPLVALPGRGFRRPPYDHFHWNDVRPVLADNSQVWILGGWSEPTFLHLWLRHFRRRIPVLFWIESTRIDRRRSMLGEGLKRLLLRHAAGCIVPGQRAAEYCRDLGMPEGRIFTAPNAADRDYFHRQAELYLPRRGALRQELSLGEAVNFLFVGRLVESLKAVSILIRAVAALESQGLRLSLSLAGEGPDQPGYQALVTELGCRDVRFLGTLGHDELCRHYAAADGLVLPSRSEVWGFVLNEAMEFGLPLVVSEAVGAGPDLVHPEENGFIVPVANVPALTTALARLAEDPARRQRMGQASRQRIAAWSPASWTRGVLQAVHAVTAPTSLSS
jgi:glycosyltransferase involved in cell wall biosynthesis